MSTTPLFEESARILVPVTLPDPQPISPWLVDFVEPLEVILLGCYQVKEQISPEQARDEFEAEASAALEEVASTFGDYIQTKLVFTPDVVDTVDRVAREHRIDVILAPAASEQIRSLLALITPEVDLERMRRCISALLEDRQDVELTIVEIVEPLDDEADHVKEEKTVVLDNLEQQLIDTGVEPEQITTRLLACEDRGQECIDVSRGYDIILMGAGEERLRSRLLREAPCPLIVVRPRSADA